MSALSSLLDNEGQYSYGHLLKEELQDVKQKSANGMGNYPFVTKSRTQNALAEQVVEVLRERLQNVVAELDESKRRNVELEGIRAKDGEALRNLAASSAY